MVLSIGERIKGFLFSPSKTFDNSKEDTLGDAFKYFVVILAIFAVIVAVLIAVLFSLFAGMLGMLGVPMMPLGAAMGPLLAVGFFIFALVGGIIGVFIDGLWLHLWVYLVGGRNGIMLCLAIRTPTDTCIDDISPFFYDIFNGADFIGNCTNAKAV